MDAKRREVMEALVKVLQKNNNVKVPKASVKDEIEKMTQSIFNNQNQHAPLKRTYEKVFQSCEYIVIEHALAWALKGKRNDLEFDHTNPDTYYYDVEADSKLMGRPLKFECKRWKRQGGDFFSYPTSGLKTMMKHKNKLDFIVAAKVTTEDDNYIVDFKRIMDAPTFPLFITKSQYNDWESYYNHYKDENYSAQISPAVKFNDDF